MGSNKNDNIGELNFIIENNIIKGEEKVINDNNQNVGQLILQNFKDKPNHVAQIEAETGKRTTYEEMKENTIRCGLWMRKQGIGSGDVIVVCTHNQLDAYIPCIATFYAGAIYNPWHHEVPLKTAQHLMNLTRPKIVFSCVSAVDVLKEAARLEKVDARFVIFGKHPEIESLKDTMKLQTREDVRTFELQEIEDQESRLSMILFSSGTTGLPKGVAHSYKSLLKNIIGFTALPKRECVSLWYSSLYWISGTFCTLQTMLTNATRILHANFDPEETCKVIEKFNVNWFFITPSMITYWCKSDALKKYKLEPLKSIMTGGSKLGREVIENFRNSLPNVIFAQGYGMTELGGVATIQTNKCESIESVGFIAPNLQIKIIDVDTNEILGPNQPGEICVKSRRAMVCYYKNPTATKEAIDEQGWLHTGDKGYYKDNGEVFIIDRLKEVLKFRGHHVSPFEIEEILVNHPGVMEVAVVAVPHEMDLERPMAFVTKVLGAKVTENELIEMSSELGEYKKLWGGVRFLEKMPHTASGKVNRKELKELAKTYSK